MERGDGHEAAKHLDQMRAQNSPQATQIDDIGVEPSKSDENVVSGAAPDDDHLINLNEAQSRNILRNTLIMIMIFALYLITGVLVFHFLCGWDILDSVYFICVTFSTIGYGDFAADHTDTELLFTSFFLIIGLKVPGGNLICPSRLSHTRARTPMPEHMTCYIRSP